MAESSAFGHGCTPSGGRRRVTRRAGAKRLQAATAVRHSVGHAASGERAYQTIRSPRYQISGARSPSMPKRPRQQSVPAVVPCRFRMGPRRLAAVDRRRGRREISPLLATAGAGLTMAEQADESCGTTVGVRQFSTETCRLTGRQGPRQAGRHRCRSGARRAHCRRRDRQVARPRRSTGDAACNAEHVGDGALGHDEHVIPPGH